MSITIATIVALATCNATLDAGVASSNDDFECRQQQVIVDLSFLDPSMTNAYLMEMPTSASGYIDAQTHMMIKIQALGRMDYVDYMEANPHLQQVYDFHYVRSYHSLTSS